jgi:hypothetical protein
MATRTLNTASAHADSDIFSRNAAGRARGGVQHTLQEWSDIESAKIGTKQIILLAAALAEVQ